MDAQAELAMLRTELESVKEQNEELRLALQKIAERDDITPWGSQVAKYALKIIAPKSPL